MITKSLAMAVGVALQSDIMRGTPRESSFRAFESAMLGDRPSKNSDTAVVEFPDMLLRWTENGFPSIVTTHRLAASLMATQLSADVTGDIRMPWETFWVHIPDGLLTRLGGSHMLWLLISQRDGSLKYIGAFSDGASVIGFRQSLKDFISDDPVLTGDPDSMVPMVDDGDLRFNRLLGRLIAGICIELDQPKHVTIISNGPPKGKRPGRTGPPKSWTFTLGRDVRVDCREWVTRYLNGDDGTPLGVQSLVRGHHKRQAHGPSRSLRKWIHVEPYWRGPDDAPIVTRSHQLAGRDTQAGGSTSHS